MKRIYYKIQIITYNDGAERYAPFVKYGLFGKWRSINDNGEERDSRLSYLYWGSATEVIRLHKNKTPIVISIKTKYL